jgi:hypothetical protein
LTLQQQSSSSPSSTTTTSSTSTTRSITTIEIEDNIQFLLYHFKQDRLFPRKIQTGKSEGRQIEVFSKQEVLFYFNDSSFTDCKINAFPTYTEYSGIQRYPPDLIFIDIDRSNFQDDKSFENALSKTLKNIKKKLNGYPTVNNSGNGYHVIQPINCPILEQIEEFQKYKINNNNIFISQEFLRFAESFLSNCKADPRHYPSFKSCQIRVPRSTNSKYNRPVKIIQKWNGVRSSVTREFLEDFRTYLEQKITDQENYNKNNYNCRYKNNCRYSNTNNNNRIEWIEKILLYPIEDYRKIVIYLILSPYLINIKKMSYDDSYRVIKEWLDKCNDIKKLDNYQNFVNYRIHSALKTATQKGIGPMSLYKIKTDSRYNTNLYLLILQNEKGN